MPESQKPLTYAESGVDIDVGNRIVDRIRPFARRTRRSGAGAELGGFGGLFDLKAAGFVDPILVAANDGVGTKVKIAVESGIYDTIGIDLVAMCVNDIVVQGAEPLFFLDYFASGKLDEEVVVRRRSGHRRGVRAIRMRIDRRRDGGDARPLRPWRFRHRRLRRGRRRTRDAAAPAGTEAGGPCLRPAVVRRSFQWIFAGAAHRRAVRPRMGGSRPVRSARSLAAALLTPTRLYVRPLLDALKRTRGIHALAHITGGGYPDNLPRVLDDGLAVSLDLDAFTPQPVFSWLASAGGLDEAEMLRTFNCGFGMAAFVSADREAEAREALAGAGLSPVLIGELVPAEGQRLVTPGG